MTEQKPDIENMKYFISQKFISSLRSKLRSECLPLASPLPRPWVGQAVHGILSLLQGGEQVERELEGGEAGGGGGAGHRLGSDRVVHQDQVGIPVEVTETLIYCAGGTKVQLNIAKVWRIPDCATDVAARGEDGGPEHLGRQLSEGAPRHQPGPAHLGPAHRHSGGRPAQGPQTLGYLK